jgi:hypothetical protein
MTPVNRQDLAMAHLFEQTGLAGKQGRQAVCKGRFKESQPPFIRHPAISNLFDITD